MTAASCSLDLQALVVTCGMMPQGKKGMGRRAAKVAGRVWEGTKTTFDDDDAAGTAGTDMASGEAKAAGSRKRSRSPRDDAAAADESDAKWTKADRERGTGAKASTKEKQQRCQAARAEVPTANAGQSGAYRMTNCPANFLGTSCTHKSAAPRCRDNRQGIVLW